MKEDYGSLQLQNSGDKNNILVAEFIEEFNKNYTANITVKWQNIVKLCRISCVIINNMVYLSYQR